MSLAAAITWSAMSLSLLALLAGAALLFAGLLGPERRVSRRLSALAGRATPQIAPPPRDRRPLLAMADPRLPWLAPKLRAANAKFSPTQVLITEILLAAALPVLLVLAGVPALLAVTFSAVLALATPILVISWMADRRRRRFVRQLPQAIDLVARGLQAGHPASAALETTARQMPDPIGPEIAIVIGEMSAGLDRDEALRNLVGRFPSPELRMFAASLEITRETGGNVAEVLLGLADRLREQAQLRRKVEALSAEGRLSFWVITGLPVLAGGALMLIRPDYYGLASKDPMFWKLMMIPPALMLIGGAFIWRMINFRV